MFIPLVLAAGVMEALFLKLLHWGDLRQHVADAIALLLVSSVFYLISCYVVLKNAQSGKPRLLLGLVVGVGLAFRLTLWPLFPAFSDDVFRYRWEGKLQAAGGNPYQVRPNDAKWTGLRDKTFSRVVVPDFKAGYGPLTEAIELATYQGVSGITGDPFAQVFWFKAPSALFDIGVAAAVYWLLRLKRLPAVRLVVYAWCPAPIFEFWANGHNDSIAVFFVIAALALAAARKPAWAVAAISLAAAAKIWPVVLLPFFVQTRSIRALMRYAGVAAAIWAACLWHYRGDLVENIRFTSGFLGGWRNNDFLFGFVLGLFHDEYRAKYFTFGMLALVVVTVLWLRPALEKAVLAVIVGMLAVSANIHPWYLTWFIPFLAVLPVGPLLLWVALMPVTYAVLIDWFALGVWTGTTGMRWCVYIPVAGYALGKGYWKYHAKRRTGESAALGKAGQLDDAA